ncbi:MAG: nucleotide exchange factor GrpE [Calditrichaeota bacterium]|nr:nucleotide exchange factor GrpE [Calditrichota bacterium]MCB9367737.1 nucleotide exchange factor GrpE [Calditrichota bacterium]
MKKSDHMNEQEKETQEVLEEERNEETAPQAPDDLEQARGEAAEWRDKYVRTLAEFDNFRKRTRAELENVRQSVAESVLTNLLTVYDDMNRMLEAPETDDGSSRRGMELIQQKFKTFLEGRGITKLECRGQEFNPDEHDAIMMQPRAGFPAGVVLEEVTPGYKLGDRVIRHAQVIVSSEPVENGDAGAGEEQQ